MFTAGDPADSLSCGAAISVGVIVKGMLVGVPVPTIRPVPPMIGRLSTLAAHIRGCHPPFTLRSARYWTCSHTPFASLPVNATTSLVSNIPSVLKSARPAANIHLLDDRPIAPEPAAPTTGTVFMSFTVTYCAVTQPLPVGGWAKTIWTQLPLGSLPITCTLVFGPIMPNAELAVDGSPRTFTCEAVVPS